MLNCISKFSIIKA